MARPAPMVRSGIDAAVAVGSPKLRWIAWTNGWTHNARFSHFMPSPAWGSRPCLGCPADAGPHHRRRRLRRRRTWRWGSRPVTPTGTWSRSTTCTGADPSSICRASARRACEFVHGDVRDRDDLAAAGDVDAVVECSAEPSVLAGTDGSLDYLVETNLFGAYACLELCRRQDAQFVFLSTSRVYPVARLLAARLEETETRFRLAEQPGRARAVRARHLRGTSRSTARARSTARRSSPPSTSSRSTPPRSGSRRSSTGSASSPARGRWARSTRASSPTGCSPTTSAGRSSTSASAAAASRCATSCTSTDAVDLIDRQLAGPRRAGPGRSPTSAAASSTRCRSLELTELCREITGKTTPVSGSDDRAARRRPALRRATAASSSRSPTGGPPAPSATSSPTSASGSRRTRTTLRRMRRMPVAIVTGSGGLIGSESVSHFVRAGYDVVGIENDMRVCVLRRRRRRPRNAPQRSARTYRRARSRSLDLDIRDADGDRARLRASTRSRSSSSSTPRRSLRTTGRRATRSPTSPSTRPARSTCSRRRAGTARPRRSSSPRRTRSTATGRTSCRSSSDETRLELPADHPYCDGIDTSMSIDRCLHSLFGVSKAAADLLVQEYGRYFDMPTVVLPRRLPDRARTTPARGCTASSRT